MIRRLPILIALLMIPLTSHAKELVYESYHVAMQINKDGTIDVVMLRAELKNAQTVEKHGTTLELALPWLIAFDIVEEALPNFISQKSSRVTYYHPHTHGNDISGGAAPGSLNLTSFAAGLSAMSTSISSTLSSSPSGSGSGGGSSGGGGGW